jgi:hypothetical protein
MAGQVGSGAAGFLLFKEEVTPGVYVTPDQTLWATAMTNAETAEQNIKAYFQGDRGAQTGVGVGKISSAGQLSFPCFPYVGIPWYKFAVGKATYMAALTADTTAGAIVTALGLSTTTLTAGNVAIAPGQWVQFGSTATLEMRQVYSYVNGSKTIVVPELLTNAAAAPGIAFMRVAQHKITPLVRGDTNFMTLPTASVSFNKGGTYEWTYAGVFASQMRWAGDNNDVMSTLDLFPTVDPVRPGSPTTFAPTGSEYSDQDKFMTINNGLIATYGDPSASGTSSMQFLKNITTWNIQVNNNVAPKHTWNLQKHVSGYPGLQGISGQYAYINQDKRNAPYEDFIAPSSSVIQSVPILISLYNNAGSVASPVPQCVGFYVPAAHFQNSISQNTVTDEEMITVDWMATRPGGGALLEIYVINSRVTTY